MTTQGATHRFTGSAVHARNLPLQSRPPRPNPIIRPGNGARATAARAPLVSYSSRTGDVEETYIAITRVGQGDAGHRLAGFQRRRERVHVGGGLVRGAVVDVAVRRGDRDRVPGQHLVGAGPEGPVAEHDRDLLAAAVGVGDGERAGGAAGAGGGGAAPAAA